MTINNLTNFDASKPLKLTLVRSASGRIPKHKATLVSLRLNRIGQSVSVKNNKATLGMIQAINYLVKVEQE